MILNVRQQKEYMKNVILMVILILAVLGCTSVPPRPSFDEFMRSAKQGDPAAQAEIGYCYQYGDGVTKDSQKALKWNHKAAEQGNAMAQHNLAVMYDEGVDIPENNSEAIKWYTKAAEQGHPSAQLNLGVMYWRGEGVEKNLQQAWGLLNQVRMSSPDNNAKWRAREALDEIKKELDSSLGQFIYPAWEDVQKSIRK
jgi:TPR repeat protein